MNGETFGGRALRYLERFPSCRILVAGDIMLDEYVWGSVRRISPEAPVPVVAVTGDSQALGGAANVAVNVSGLKARVHLAGFVGGDPAGREVVRMLRRRRIGVSAVVADGNGRTIVKTRVIAHSQQVVRVDREKEARPDGRVRDALRRAALSLVREVDGVVLSDYRKGALSQELVSEIIALAARRGVFVAVDPKRNDFSFYRGCTLITPNKGEAESALGGRELAGDPDIWRAGKDLLKACGARAVLITRGEEGMTLVERGKKSPFVIRAEARQVFDVTGAGDTVIGTMAASMGVGAPLKDAALLANVAAGVVVGEVGTSPITAEKLKRALLLTEREKDVPPPGGPASGRRRPGPASAR